MRQYAVIGLGRFGSSVAQALSEKKQQVLGIDIDEAKVQGMSEVLAQAVCVDAKDEKALRAVGMENMDVAVVAIGTNLEASILVTLMLKEIGVKEIVAKAVSEDHGKVLKKIGATRVVMPEWDMGQRVAASLLSPHVIEHIELSDEFGLVELIPPEEFVGRSLRQLDVRAKYGVNVIAVKKKKQAITPEGDIIYQDKVDVAPHADDVIKESDLLIVIGSNDDIEKIRLASEKRKGK